MHCMLAGIIKAGVYFYPDSLFGDESRLNTKGKGVFTKRFTQTYALWFLMINDSNKLRFNSVLFLC